MYTAAGDLIIPTGTARLTTWLTRLRFVDVEGTSSELLALESLNCGLRLAAVGHFNEAKPTGAAGGTVGNDIDGAHGPIRFKELADVMISRIKRKITYKNIVTSITTGDTIVQI